MELAQINRRFDGFRSTPLLWKESLEGLKTYKTHDELSTKDCPQIDTKKHIRLGKLTEQFVLFELVHDPSIQLLASNLQIFENRITIGELDCLIQELGQNIHLEIVYKFYLYDPAIPDELSRWIGPNRNDSLVFKLNKLKEKQLRLLYHPETVKRLNELGLNPAEFQQQVNFRAQLFVPLGARTEPFQFINQDCIKGFYIRYSELSLFENYTYYIPDKLDWLIIPHLGVEWMSNQAFQYAVSVLLKNCNAPLCWMKSTEGKMQKFFIVWWD